jgi:hypothetical protein
MDFQQHLDVPLPTGSWTFYYHPVREKRWTADTFQSITTVHTLRETLQLFHEMDGKLRQGMYFFMCDPHPPLWENAHNIRGGSYSLRAGPESAIEYYKMYVISSMMHMTVKQKADSIVGVTISPKILQQGGSHKIGFYVIKIWNKDSSKFKDLTDLHLVSTKLSTSDVIYTPHVDKKM